MNSTWTGRARDFKTHCFVETLSAQLAILIPTLFFISVWECKQYFVALFARYYMAFREHEKPLCYRSKVK